MSGGVCRRELTVRITLRSPFVTRALTPDSTVIDAPLARNAAGDYILPGTLIRGVVRDALETMAERMTGDLDLGGISRPIACDVSALLGRGSGDKVEKKADEAPKDMTFHAVNNSPDRGALDFKDLEAVTRSPRSCACREKDHSDGTMTRICIDDDLGAAKEGHMQVIELPWPIGAEVKFEGVVGIVGDGTSLERVRTLIERALLLAPAIGAMKSAGFGEVIDAKVENAVEIEGSATADPATSSAAAPIPTTADEAFRLAFALSLDRPFVVDAERVAGNVFRGRAVIPGAVIKGALARALQAAGWWDDDMSRTLAGLTITHAFPVKADGDVKVTASAAVRAHVLPLSWVKTDGGFTDILTRNERVGTRRPDGALTAYVFAEDWKDDDRVRAHKDADMALAKIRRDVRTRTAIDRDRGGAKVDAESGGGQLFSTSAVVADGHVWVGRLASPCTDAVRLRRITDLMAAGIPGIGKTDAVAWAKWLTDAPPPAAQKLASEDAAVECYAVTMQTPALLNDLGTLRNQEPLADNYASYWKSIGYTLERFYARQRIIGGYLALRYPARTDRYDVYLATEPGSVFLVRPDRSSPQFVSPDDLAVYGLPLNASVTGRTWETCPFPRENGFGQVAFNAVDHGTRPADFKPMESPRDG